MSLFDRETSWPWRTQQWMRWIQRTCHRRPSMEVSSWSLLIHFYLVYFRNIWCCRVDRSTESNVALKLVQQGRTAIFNHWIDLINEQSRLPVWEATGIYITPDLEILTDMGEIAALSGTNTFGSSTVPKEKTLSIGYACYLIHYPLCFLSVLCGITPESWRLAAS